RGGPRRSRHHGQREQRRPLSSAGLGPAGARSVAGPCAHARYPGSDPDPGRSALGAAASLHGQRTPCRRTEIRAVSHMNQRQQRSWLGRAFLSSAVFVIIVTIGCTIPEVRKADKLAAQGRWDEALDAYERAVELDPSLLAALEGITTLTQQQRAATALGGSSAPLTLRFQNAKLKEVFEILARAGGINVLFDKEVRDEPVTIFIKDTPFEQALNLILSLNALAARRIGPDTLLILPNTK